MNPQISEGFDPDWHSRMLVCRADKTGRCEMIDDLAYNFQER